VSFLFEGQKQLLRDGIAVLNLPSATLKFTCLAVFQPCSLAALLPEDALDHYDVILTGRYSRQFLLILDHNTIAKV
jgi:hypothetical protein